MVRPAVIPTGLRRAAVAVSAVRVVLPLLALPLAARLIPTQLPWLILLRPGREVVMLGGALRRTIGDPTVAAMFVAYLPLMTVGVWAFFVVGRAYGPQLRDGTGPAWLRRVAPPERLELAARVLVRRGATIAILGRLAALPPTLVAAAAGASGMDGRRYLAADLVGMVVTFVSVVTLGYLLGDAYERGGPWLAASGVVVLLAAAHAFRRWLRREAKLADVPPAG